MSDLRESALTRYEVYMATDPSNGAEYVTDDPSPTGEYVRYHDAERLAARIAELERENAELEEELDACREGLVILAGAQTRAEKERDAFHALALRAKALDCGDQDKHWPIVSALGDLAPKEGV